MQRNTVRVAGWRLEQKLEFQDGSEIHSYIEMGQSHVDPHDNYAGVSSKLTNFVRRSVTEALPNIGAAIGTLVCLNKVGKYMSSARHMPSFNQTMVCAFDESPVFTKRENALLIGGVCVASVAFFLTCRECLKLTVDCCCSDHED